MSDFTRDEHGNHVHGAWCHPAAEGCPDDIRCSDCGWTGGDHAWLCPVRQAQPYSDGKTLWGPVCDCGQPVKPHRHGVSS